MENGANKRAKVGGYLIVTRNQMKKRLFKDDVVVVMAEKSAISKQITPR